MVKCLPTGNFFIHKKYDQIELLNRKVSFLPLASLPWKGIDWFYMTNVIFGSLYR